MELVVDSNYLNDPDLDAFLRKSKDNIAVLIDYAQIEAVKSVNIEMLRERLETLSKYSSQVKILKSTKNVCGLSGRSSKLRSRLIDKKQTQHFKGFSRQVFGDTTIDKIQQNLVIKGAVESKSYLDRLRNDLFDFTEIFGGLANEFTQHEKTLLRKTGFLPESGLIKLFKLISLVAGTVHKKHPYANIWPADHEWPNTFIFRNTVFQMLHFVEWMKKGSPQKRNLQKIQNDLIDLNFCTYATFFDGLLTKDKNCLARYNEGNDMLKKSIIPGISRIT